MRTHLLHAVLPACTGAAIDAAALRALLEADAHYAAWLTAYVSHASTRFDARIDEPERALRAAGGQTAALLALLSVLSPLLTPASGLSPALTPWIWRDLLLGGCLARSLAEADRRAEPDLAFTLTVLAGIEAPLRLADDAAAALSWWEAAQPPAHPATTTRTAVEVAGGPCALLDWLEPDGAPDALDHLVRRARALAASLGPHGATATTEQHLQDIVRDWRCPPEGARALVDGALRTAGLLAAALGLPFAAPSGLGDPDRPLATLSVRADLQADALGALQREVDALTDEMRRRRRADPLTGAVRFTRFVRMLDVALHDDERAPDAIIAVDLPHFSRCFTRFGARASDRVIADAADALRRALPEPVLTRAGPATFLATFRGSTRDAHIAAARAEAAVGALRDPDGAPLRARAVALPLDAVPADAPAELIVEAARRAVLPDAPQVRPRHARGGLTSRRR